MSLAVNNRSLLLKIGTGMQYYCKNALLVATAYQLLLKKCKIIDHGVKLRNVVVPNFLS